MLDFDDIIRYVSRSHSRPGFTRVRLFCHNDQRIAICTELFSNPGPSITNAAGDLARILFGMFGESVQIIEHYPYEGEKETFDRFDPTASPAWMWVSKPDVEAMIGQPLRPHRRADERPLPTDGGISSLHYPRPAIEAAEDIAREIAWLKTIGTSDEPTFIGSTDPRGRFAIVIRDTTGSRRLVHHVRHSPTGFSTGYNGSGCADAARCMLVAALALMPKPGADDDDRFPEVESVYQRFKREVVSQLPLEAPWELPHARVRDWYERQPDRPDICSIHRESVSIDGCHRCYAEQEQNKANQP